MENFFAQWDQDMLKLGKNMPDLFEQISEKKKQHPDNICVVWRMVWACLFMFEHFRHQGKSSSGKKYVEESLEHAKHAVAIAPDSLEAHKWFCASVGNLCNFVGANERIAYGYEFKQHRDQAAAIDPNDPLMHHMSGRWCYEVSKLNWIERQFATAFLGSTPPSATMDEALEAFMKAHAAKDDSVINHHWIAKVHYARKDFAEAKKWIEAGLAIEPQTDEEVFERRNMLLLQRKVK